MLFRSQLELYLGLGFLVSLVLLGMRFLDIGIGFLCLIPIWLGFLFQLKKSDFMLLASLGEDDDFIADSIEIFIIAVLLFFLLTYLKAKWRNSLEYAAWLGPIASLILGSVYFYYWDRWDLLWIGWGIFLGTYILHEKDRLLLDLSFLTLGVIVAQSLNFFYWHIVFLCVGLGVLRWAKINRIYIWKSSCVGMIVVSAFYINNGLFFPLIVGFGCLSIFYLIHARVVLVSGHVYVGFLFLGLQYFLAKDLGYINSSGYSSFALVVLSIGLEYLSRRLPPWFEIYVEPLGVMARLLPIVAVIKEWNEGSNPLIFLLSGLVYEFLQTSASLSYTRLLGLICYNLCVYTLTGTGEMFLELMSASIGFSILWYAKALEKQVRVDVLQILKLTGNFMFYFGAVWRFVSVLEVKALLILWILCTVGGWLAIYFKARLQLFSTILVFISSVLFFILKLVLQQISTGILGLAGLGAFLLIVGIFLEKNRERLKEYTKSLKQQFREWSD